MNELQQLEYSQQIKEDLLCFELCDPGVENIQYAFYVKRNGRTINKIRYSEKRGFTYKIQESGLYEVVAFWKYNDEIRLQVCAALKYFPNPALRSKEHSAEGISIFGSCVSRDILEYASSGSFALKTYIARQSILSATSNQINDIADEDILLESQFQKRMVLADLRKNAFDTLKNDGSKYLLIDLIDERFPLALINGSICTASNEFVCGLPEKRKLYPQAKKRLVKDTLYLEKRAMDERIDHFCKLLSEIYPADHIVLHRAKMVDRYIAKNGEIVDFSKAYLKNNLEVNTILEHMYCRIEKCIPGIRIIDEMQGTFATESHKWGLSPMHYEEGYYHRVLNKLLSFIY